MSGGGTSVYRIAICDDDADYVKYLKEQIEELLREEAEFFLYASGEELLADEALMHDLIFLDIQMDGLDGNETARRLRQHNKGAVLVFCSGVYQPTPESIRMAPFRYLLKNSRDEEIQEDLRQILEKMRQQPKWEYLIVKGGGKLERVSVFDIVYISKIKRGSQIYLVGPHPEQVQSDLHISSLYQQLSKYGFAFPHDSYLVNCRWITSFNSRYLTMYDGSEKGMTLNIARSKKEEFTKQLVAYWEKHGRQRTIK